jgi:REP element-mobilizing transposase RayT
VSRLRRIADCDRIFFITTNLLDGVPPLSADERTIVLDQLKRQRADAEFWLFGYVVMPTHVHLLLMPNAKGMSAIMHRFKRFTALELGNCRAHNRAVWQPRYFDFALRQPADFGEKLEYIHNNPVEAHMVHSAADWPWSSAAHYLKSAPAPVPIDPLYMPADYNAASRRDRSR